MYYKELRAGKNSVTESIIFDPDLSNVDYSKEFKLPEYGNENFSFYKRSSEDKKVWTCPLVTKISRVKFDNSVKIFITETKFCWASLKGNKWRGKGTTYCIRIDENNIPYFTVNGKFIYRFYQDFSNIFQKCQTYLRNLGLTLLNNIDVPLDVNEYYYRRNFKIQQIPASKKVIKEIYYSRTSSQTKAKIRYQLNKGDTAKAVELFLKGSYPKSIRKYFLNNTIYWYLLEKNSNQSDRDTGVDDLEKISILAALLKLVDINLIIRSLNNDIDPKYCYNIAIRLDDQYDFKTIMNYYINQKQTRLPAFTMYNDYYRDAAFAYRSLKYEFNIISKVNRQESIKEYHDRLTRELSFQRDNRESLRNAKYKEPWKSKLVPCKNSGYKVRPLTTIYEMKTIGDYMNICVGSYMSSQYNNRLEIAVVEDSENNYVACLEILNRELVQAKLKYNSPLYNNETINNIVLSWCKLNHLKINSRDIDNENARRELSYDYLDLLA